MPKELRTVPMSFKTFPKIKKKLVRMADISGRSLSRQMEFLIKHSTINPPNKT